MDVRQIATDTLRDVAVATFVHGRPTIYYNPVLLQGFGPRMAEFFFAHEYGHLRYGHAGGALSQEDGEVSQLRQRQELEADCYAAEVLGHHHREAVETALRFFRRMGPYRYDVFHPTGAQRAAKILSCLPAEMDAATRRPRGGRPGGGDRELHGSSPAASAGEYAVEARVWIDDDAVGTVSSIRQPGSVEVRGLPAGAHRYRVSVKLYAFDAMLQLNPSGGASGGGADRGGTGLGARGPLAGGRGAHAGPPVARRPLAALPRHRASLCTATLAAGRFVSGSSSTLMESRLARYIGSACSRYNLFFTRLGALPMPRSLLLPLIAVFALAACSKQADTGAAPAPETAEAPDAAAPADTGMVADTAAVPADATVPAEEPAMEEPAADTTAPAEAPAADAPIDSTMPADSATWPADSAAAQ